MTPRRPPASPRTAGRAKAAREAKGSVHEAIGKLLGDDDAEAHGAAEQQAAAKDDPERR